MSDVESRQNVCRILSGLFLFLGALGMVTSFLYLASASFADITAGTSGFVAGSVLIGSGLVALAMLARGSGERQASRTTE